MWTFEKSYDYFWFTLEGIAKMGSSLTSPQPSEICPNFLYTLCQISSINDIIIIERIRVKTFEKFAKISTLGQERYHKL